MITPCNAALIIIDIQGKLSTLMHEKVFFFSRTRSLIQASKQLNIPVILAEQVPDKLGPTTEAIAELLPHTQPICKTTFSCCGNAQFIQTLQQLDKEYLLIAGIETHICVYQTVSDLLKRGKHVHVIADATASRTAENKQIGLNRMQSEGAVISSVEMCLFEMLQDVSADQFSAISQLIK